MATAASTPLTQAQIQQYQNPYTQNVINATQAQFNNQNQQQQQQLSGNAIAQGALGGNRVGVAQAQLAGQQQLAQAPVLAGLASQGYQQGVQTALSQQQAQAQGAYSLGALGTAGQNAALTGAGAQVGAGTLQQSTQQAQDQAAYQQFMQKQAYPFQTTQWLAGIDTGVGSQLGGTSTSNGSTTGPAPSPFGQIAGLGLAAAGAFLKDGGAVRGFDTGGGIGGTPYAGSSGWVPSIGITAGHGAPSPQGGPNAAGQQQQMDPFKMASSAADLSKKLQGGFGFGDPMNIDSGGYAGTGGFDLGTEGGVTGGLGGLYARGGHVRGYDDGGMVAGLDVPTFDQRFNGNPDIPSPLDTAQWPAGPVNSPGPIVKGDQPSPLDTAAYPSGPVGAPSIDTSPSIAPDAPKPIAGIAAEPATGTAPLTPSIAGDKNAPTQGYAANIANLSHAVKTVESGGNYQAIGPQTRTGDRAYGAYQVMGANIPQWTKEILGQSLTPQQFLASTEAQDAVARAKLGQYANKYGPEGAAKAWFAGEGGMNNPNATDALGTTVSSYGNKVMSFLGEPPSNQGIKVAGLGDVTLPPNAQPAQYQGKKPEAEQGPLGKLLSGVGINLSPAAKQAILSAGFGMMASRSPFAGNAIGEGGLQGMQTYAGAKAAEQKSGIENRKVDFEAKKLSQAADQAAKRLALDTSKFTETQEQHKFEQMKPIKIGEDMFGDIMAVRDKSGQFRIIDKKTGKLSIPVDPNAVPQSPMAPPVAAPPGNVAANEEDEGAIPAKAKLVQAETPRNEDFLKTVEAQDSNLAKLVKSIANYEINPSSLSTKGGHREKILGIVSQYDPTYSMPLYTSRAAAIKEFNSGGPNSPAGTITAGNTAIQHLARLSDVAENLGGTSDWGILNKPLNAMNIGSKEWQNNPDLARYKNAQDRFVEEATKFYRGVGGTQADIERAISALTAAQSPLARRAAIAEQAELMQSKINALQERYQTAMGPTAWGRATKNIPDFPITHQKSEEGLVRIRARDAESSGRGAIAAPVGPTQTASAIPPLAERKIGQTYQTPKGPATWTEGGWKLP